MKSLDVVAAIILNTQGQILLAQRPEGKHLAGFWEFPGGKIEFGESHEEALHRELLEELNLTVRIRQAMGVFSHAYEPLFQVRLSVFIVEALSIPAPSRDVAVFLWKDPQEIQAMDLAPADREPWRLFLSQTRLVSS